MIKIKVAFLEGRLLSSKSEQFKKYSKSCDWLEKSRLSKNAAFVMIIYTCNVNIPQILTFQREPNLNLVGF